MCLNQFCYKILIGILLSTSKGFKRAMYCVQDWAFAHTKTIHVPACMSNEHATDIFILPSKKKHFTFLLFPKVDLAAEVENVTKPEFHENKYD